LSIFLNHPQGCGQQTLFPQSVDEYIHADVPVRAYDVIVDSLDLETELKAAKSYLGFRAISFNLAQRDQKTGQFDSIGS
jgi:hypothetical protein